MQLPSNRRRGVDSSTPEWMYSTRGASQLLSAAEEKALAREFVAAEVATWRAVLDYPPAIAAIGEALEQSAAEQGLRIPGEVCTLARLSTGVREPVVADADRNAYDRARTRAAGKLRARDRDRLLATAARACVQQLASDERCTKPLRAYAERVEAAYDAHTAVKNRFIHANLRLVMALARRFRHTGMPHEDVIQEGNLGLVKAVERFDPGRGFRFSTYAAWWIRHMITRGIEDKARVVRIPVHTQQRMRRVSKANESFRARHGRSPTAEELAAQVELTKDQVRDCLPAYLSSPASLDRQLGDDSRTTWIDQLEDEDAVSPDEHLNQQELRAVVERCMDVLSPMQEDILRSRFGLDSQEPQTLREIGDRYGLSRERIRQLQEEALAACRDALAARAKQEPAMARSLLA